MNKNNNGGYDMVEPIRGKVAIKQLDPEEMTSGGVILPDISQEGISRGVVKAVGPAAYNFGTLIEPMVKVGDIVAYPKRGAYTLEMEEGDILIISEIDLFCIIKRGENNG